MTSQIIPVEPFDFIAFGGTGDLAERKLLPALYQRQRAGQFSEPTRIIGASRSKLSDDEYREFARKAITEHVKAAEIDQGELAGFLARLTYVGIDAKTGEGFEQLKNTLGDSDRIRVIYMAVAPALFGDIAKKVREHGLVTAKTRIVVEKPIGRDLASARALNDQIGEVFDEHQIFRIDHYLGKETVQNLMALRFANALYEPLWNSAHIDHVQITVAETVGLEDRIGYYDKAGALRDMVQNHILQLLCLVAMEAPSSMDADAVRDEKLKVLRSLKRINGLDEAKLTVRGQYRAGASSGGAVKGYIEELANGESNTETFVAIKAEIANWRWAGVPFYVRTGKRLATRVSEIVIEFKHIPHSIFGEGAGRIQANQLVIRLQPDEGVKTWIMIKDPGPGGMRLRQIALDMSFAESFQERNPDA
ncbi:MAG: glucose-6-phosphate dehydrogenase, partial [Mesorhizobium sp.]|nr:glucose-6-phosphate dehydrogenase [Mesorhizobium sp.]